MAEPAERPTPEQEIARTIKAARKHQDLTLGEVARRTGVASVQLSMMERATFGLPEPDVVLALAACLDIDRVQLLRWAGHGLTADTLAALTQERDDLQRRVDKAEYFATERAKFQRPLAAHVAELEAQLAQARKAGPYPPSEQTRLLADATAHLFDVHDCDHIGWETWRAALDAAVLGVVTPPKPA